MLTRHFRTDEELVSYLKTIWFPGASSNDIQAILKLYPSDPVDGSPFGTGSAEAFTPEYKRIAAIQGDLFFHSPRRQLLDRFSSTHATYSFCGYLSPRGASCIADPASMLSVSARTNLSGIGYVSSRQTFHNPCCAYRPWQAHGTDLLNAFGPGDMTDYFIRFVRHLDPNGDSSTGHWPLYNTSSRLTLQFNDGSIPLKVTTDTERLAGTDALLDLSLRFPF